MTHNFPANFKLIYFLFWIKVSHQSTHSEISKCLGENFPNSLCHFWKHKSFFLQILRKSSVRSKMTPLYFVSENIIYFTQKEPINIKIFVCLYHKLSNSILKWQANSSSKFSSFFSVITYNSSVMFYLIHFCFGEKDPNKVFLLTHPCVLLKTCQIPNVTFQTTSQFFSKFSIIVPCHER